jgi:cellulose synthase operon protein B
MKIGLLLISLVLITLMSAAGATPAHHPALTPLASQSAPAADQTPTANSAPVSANNAVNTLRLPFSVLGAFDPIHLRGLSDMHSIGVGVRRDRVVTAAHLHLVYTYSPSLIFSLSHIRVLMNNQVVATVPFDSEHAGRPTATDIPIDPRFFADFNQLSLELVAHYSMVNCEDPANTALWADISPTSEVVLDQQAVKLPDDLALLPAPFFDRRDSAQLVLPFVLPAAPGDEMIRNAAVIASWFGSLADYRGAKFPIMQGFPAADNAVVVATADTLPAGLDPGKIDGPTLMVVPNPRATDRKLLLVLGRNTQELRTAAYALVLGKMVLAGPSATVGNVDIGPPRKPYDAPKWLPVDRPVQFKDIVANSDLLQVQGGAPDPVRIDMHVPADLFAWNGRGVPLDLKYRYTAPSVINDSSLSVSINGLLIKSYHLRPSGTNQDQAQLGQLRLPLLSDGTSGVSSSISIPAFRVGSDNQLQLKFTMDSQKTGVCSGVSNNPSRAAIDPDSVIDFSGFVHYALMPNLAFFANSGFPFTTYADLAQTLVVIPDAPTATDIETVLALMGEMGKWTGFPALRVQIMHASEVQGTVNKDLLVVGSGATAALMKGWSSVAPLQISAATGVAAHDHYRFTVRMNQQEGVIDAVARTRALLSESGSFGTLVGFQSPYAKYRSVVALAATDGSGLGQVVDALQNAGLVSQVQGDLTIVRGQDVQGLRAGPEYLVGDFPWYARVWVVAIKYPLALATLGVLAGILVAIGAFLGLQTLASRRRGL